MNDGKSDPDADPQPVPVWSVTDEVSYEPGRLLAHAAAVALRDALMSVGLGGQFPHLRPEVSIFGHGLVVVGRIEPATAHRLAELLRGDTE